MLWAEDLTVEARRAMIVVPGAHWTLLESGETMVKLSVEQEIVAAQFGPF